MPKRNTPSELQKEIGVARHRAELERKRRAPRGFVDTPAGPLLVVGKPVRR